MIVVVIVLILAIGSLAFPDLIWDGFLWKYFAGPVYADAEGESVDGISEGYNPVNTLAYGLILAASVYAIYTFLERKKVNVDGRFIGSIVPFVLLGSILRVLEDAEFFSEPVNYLMISPLIYIVVGLFTIFMLYLSIVFQEMMKEASTLRGLGKAESYLNLTWISIFSLYVIFFFLFHDSFIYIEHPIAALVLIIFILFVTKYLLGTVIKERKPGEDSDVKFGENSDVKHSENSDVKRSENSDVKRGEKPPVYYHIFLGGIGWFICAISLYHLCWWGWHHGEDLHMVAVPGIFLLAFLSWGLTLLLLRLLSEKKNLELSTSLSGANSLMIFSQFLDGAATYTGLDFYGYREKHVLPSFLIDLTGTAAVMFLLKLFVLLLAIYLLDIEYKKELQEYPRLSGLIKLVVIILGLAPSTRDMLRLAFGT